MRVRTLGSRIGIASSLVIALLFSPTLAAEPVAPAKPAAPTEPDRSTPEAVFHSYNAALKANDWAAAARLHEPEGMASLHRFMATMLARDKTGEAGRQLFGLAQGQTIDSLTPESMFAKLMTMWTASMPGVSDLIGTAKISLLGKVPEEDMVHVVQRTTMGVEG